MGIIAILVKLGEKEIKEDDPKSFGPGIPGFESVFSNIPALLYV